MSRDPSTRPATWRGLIKVHPAAEQSPMMSDDEQRALAADIDEHGLQHSIVFYCDRDRAKLSRKERRAVDALDAGSVVLLDGRNRIEAVERFGKKYTLWGEGDDRAGAILYVGDFRLPGDTVVLDPITCPDPYAYVISANIHRRHLTGEQKRELIASLLKATPERSDRQIAQTVKASPTTVGTVRAKLEQAGDVSKLDTRLDALGRQQPAPKLATVAEIGHAIEKKTGEKITARRQPTPAEVRQAMPEMLMHLSALLRLEPDRTLEELIRVLARHRIDIAALPPEKRVAAARGLLRVLSVAYADLAPIE